MRLAVFTKNLTNPAYGAARLGAERAAARLGAEVQHFVPQKPDDPEEQSALIAQALSQPFDAYVLSPVHATRVDPAIQRIAAQGRPIVSFVSPINVVPCVAHVSSDDYALAVAIAAYLFARMQGRGRVLVVGGPQDAFTSVERLRGFRDEAARHPQIVWAGEVAGDYAREVARERTAQWLRTHPAPDACLVANDVMALGVLDALDAARCSALVVGVNAIPDAIQAIASGRMLATGDFNAMQIAYLATECAARHVRGEHVPTNVELPVEIVDHGNYRRWDWPYAQRGLRTLEQMGLA